MAAAAATVMRTAVMSSMLRFKRRDTPLPAHLVEHRMLFDKSTDVATLNNTGISLFSQGRERCPYAAAYFARAVLIAMNADNNTGASTPKKPKFRPFKFVQKRILGKKQQVVENAADPASTTNTGTANTTAGTTTGLSIITSTSPPKHQHLHIFKDMVPIENGCDDEHVIKTTVLYNIANACAVQGKFENAQNWFNRCHALISERRNDAIDAGIKLMHNCGYVNFQLGRYAKALEFWDCCLTNAVRRNQQGWCKNILESFMVLSQVHQEEGRDAEALQVLTKAQPSAIKAFSPEQTEHAAWLMKLYQQMAELSRKLGDLPKSLEHNEKLLELQLKVLEQDHEETLDTLATIAYTLKRLHKYVPALERYQQLLEAETRKYRDDDRLLVAETLDEIAWIQLQLQDYERAMDAHQGALQIRRDLYGDEHFEVTIDLEQVSYVLGLCAAHDAAMDAMWEALTIRIKLLGKNHEQVATLWHSLGNIYMEMGQSDEALKCEQEALRIYKAVFGEVHVNVGEALRHLGFVYLKRGEQPLGLELYREKLAVERKLKGPNDLYIASLLELIASFHLNIGQVQEFMECMAEALRIRHHHGQTADSLQPIMFDTYHLSKLHPECAAVA